MLAPFWSLLGWGQRDMEERLTAWTCRPLMVVELTSWQQDWHKKPGALSSPRGLLGEQVLEESGSALATPNELITQLPPSSASGEEQSHPQVLSLFLKWLWGIHWCLLLIAAWSPKIGFSAVEVGRIMGLTWPVGSCLLIAPDGPRCSSPRPDRSWRQEDGLNWWWTSYL